MNAPGKPYRVSIAPSGPGQWALIVRSLRVPAAVVRLEGFGSRAHARRFLFLAVADLAAVECRLTIETRNVTLYIRI